MCSADGRVAGRQMRVQPDEAIYMKMVVKKPGLDMDAIVSEMDLSYKQRYSGSYIPDAYERLLLDALRGDQQHFVRRCGPCSLAGSWVVHGSRHRQTDMSMQLAELGDVPALRSIAVCVVLYLFVSGTLHLPSVVTETVPLQCCVKVFTERACFSCVARQSACPPGHRDELRAAWAAFTPLLHAIDAGEVAPLPYAAGTRGPAAADELAGKAGFVKTASYEWKEASAGP